MDTQQHTPGPWTVGPDGFYVLGASAHNGPTYITTVECDRAHDRNRYSKPGDAAKVNARLIAAAPDMLAALKGIALAMETNPRLKDVMIYSGGTSGERLYPFDAVVAAIAKATGK